MDADLFNAILSMDSYNRNYNQGIDLRLRDANGNLVLDAQGNPIEPATIGAATILTDSANLGFIAGTTQRADESDGFYAIAYQYGSTVTIAYRGTDKFTPGSFDGVNFGGDIYNSYGSGAGLSETSQSILAFAFYKTVAAQAALSGDTVTLTGHSLGGGLAGFVGEVENVSTTVFESMAYAANDNYKSRRAGIPATLLVAA